MRNKLSEVAINAAISFQNFAWTIEYLIEKEVEDDAQKGINSINKFLN